MHWYVHGADGVFPLAAVTDMHPEFVAAIDGMKGSPLLSANGRMLPAALLYDALGLLMERIERCGGSVELTNAVCLAGDLRSAIGNQYNAPIDGCLFQVHRALAEAFPERYGHLTKPTVDVVPFPSVQGRYSVRLRAFGQHYHFGPTHLPYAEAVNFADVLRRALKEGCAP